MLSLLGCRLRCVLSKPGISGEFSQRQVEMIGAFNVLNLIQCSVLDIACDRIASTLRKVNG